MNINAIIIEQIDWDETARSFQMKASSEVGDLFWVAFPLSVGVSPTVAITIKFRQVVPLADGVKWLLNSSAFLFENYHQQKQKINPKSSSPKSKTVITH